MNDKDGKTLEDEGQLSIVFGKMNEFNNNVGHNVSMAKVTLIPQTNFMQNSKGNGSQEDYPKKLAFGSKGTSYTSWNNRKIVPCPQEESLGVYSFAFLCNLMGFISRYG